MSTIKIAIDILISVLETFLMQTNLRKWRIERRLTVQALARHLGASKSMISKWERGHAMPRRNYLKKITIFTNGEVTADSFVDVAA